MTTEQMIEELYRVAGKHKNDVVGVGELNLHAMCMDVAKRLQELLDKKLRISEWIPCSERLPIVENEVLILAKRKSLKGTVYYVITSGMYEDGTVRENDSIWCWQDITGEWDEEEDCYIIPEGWWEYRHYNPDDVYNNCIDDEVIAWMPLPEPYNPNTCKNTECPFYCPKQDCVAKEGCGGYTDE